MVGQRLAEARRRAGLVQAELAAELGDRYDQTVISAVEHDRSSLRLEGATIAARALGVSLDYLVGLTDDPTPSAQLTEVAAVSDPESPDGGEFRPAPVRELDAAAGVGTHVLSEEVTGRLWFRRDWLQRHGIDPARCSVIGVSGDSMEPTLPNGCSVLVDYNRQRRRQGHIFVLRTEDGLVVKRLGKDDAGGWVLLSDNPGWETVPMHRGDEIIGEVRWMGWTFE